MPFRIIRNDITKVKADAIVNAAAPSLLGGGGGVDGAIHAAAGLELLAECRTLGGCAAGEAKITKGYGLPARYVIHTVGPVWTGGENGEESILAVCYRNSLALARESHLKSIAFPLIATGTFGYPKDKALQTAMAEISAFVLTDDMTVYLVVFDEKAFALSERLVSSVQEYIDANYVAAYSFRRAGNRSSVRESNRSSVRSGNQNGNLGSVWVGSPEADWLLQDMVQPRYIQHAPAATPRRGLDEAIGRLGETFSQATLRLIDERGLTDPIVCRKANIDRRLLWKIRNKADYQPGKQTVVALAFALELSLDETQDLLAKAGFTLSPSKLFDVIVRFFLEESNYDTFELNEVLFALRQKLIGVA